MAMKLDTLEVLYDNMKKQNLSKTKFDFQFRDLSFSVIYLAEKFPHELLLGCRAKNLFFHIQVSEDFTISTYLGEGYDQLIEALDLKANPSNPFRSNIFFEALRLAIPKSTTPQNIPTITDIAIHRRDVEEANKIYFMGWLNHDGKSSKPSSSNLEKTLKICGISTFEICVQHHISSRWTDDANRAVKYHAPNNK